LVYFYYYCYYYIIFIKGFFVERPLPSYGLLPFFRTFVCELDYSCYNRSIDNNYDENFYELIKSLTKNINELISENSLEILNILSELFRLNQAINNNSSLISLQIQKRNITQVWFFIRIIFNNNWFLVHGFLAH
jgi:hypothetical protein